MNYAQIRKIDTANGTGIRTTLFVSGCTHNCIGCFNQEYQDFRYGNAFTPEIENQIMENLKPSYINGLTILGGEPLQQPAKIMVPFLEKIRAALRPGQNIWIYSGYTYEEISHCPKKLSILWQCDILVDGKFVEELKNLRLKFRGSSNQRIIDIQETIRLNQIKEHIC